MGLLGAYAQLRNSIDENYQSQDVNMYNAIIEIRRIMYSYNCYSLVQLLHQSNGDVADYLNVLMKNILAPNIVGLNNIDYQGYLYKKFSNNIQNYNTTSQRFNSVSYAYNLRRYNYQMYCYQVMVQRYYQTYMYNNVQQQRNYQEIEQQKRQILADQSIKKVLENEDILDILSFLVEKASIDELNGLDHEGKYEYEDDELLKAIQEIKKLMASEDVESFEVLLTKHSDSIKINLGYLMDRILDEDQIDLLDDEYFEYLEDRFGDSYQNYQSIKAVLDDQDVIDMLSFLVEKASIDELNGLDHEGKYEYEDDELLKAVQEIKKLMASEDVESFEELLKEYSDDIQNELGPLMERILDDDEIDLSDEEYFQYLEDRFDDSYQNYQSIKAVLDDQDALDMLSFLVEKASIDELNELDHEGKYEYEDDELLKAVQEIKIIMRTEGISSFSELLSEYSGDIQNELGSLMEKILDGEEIDLSDEEYFKYLEDRFDNSYQNYQSIKAVLDDQDVLDMLSFLVEEASIDELDHEGDYAGVDYELLSAIQEIRTLMKTDHTTSFKKLLNNYSEHVVSDLGSLMSKILDDDTIGLDDEEYLVHLKDKYNVSLQNYNEEKTNKFYQHINEILNDKDTLNMLSYLVDNASNDELQKLNIQDSRYYQSEDNDLYAAIKQLQKLMQSKGYDDLEDFLKSPTNDIMLPLGDLMEKLLDDSEIDLSYQDYLEYLQTKFQVPVQSQQLDLENIDLKQTAIDLQIREWQDKLGSKWTQTRKKEIQRNETLSKFKSMSEQYSKTSPKQYLKDYETLAVEHNSSVIEMQEVINDQVHIEPDINNILQEMQNNKKIESYQTTDKGSEYEISLEGNDQKNIEIQFSKNGSKASIAGVFDLDSYVTMIDIFIRANNITEASAIKPKNIPINQEQIVENIIQEMVEQYAKEIDFTPLSPNMH